MNVQRDSSPEKETGTAAKGGNEKGWILDSESSPEKSSRGLQENNNNEDLPTGILNTPEASTSCSYPRSTCHPRSRMVNILSTVLRNGQKRGEAAAEQASGEQTTPRRNVDQLERQKRLSDHGELFEKKIEMFVQYFTSSCNLRSSTSNPGFDVSFLPVPSEFEETLREAAMSGTNLISRQSRLQGVTRSTVRRAAMSSVYFLVYARMKANKVFNICNIDDTVSHSKAVLNKLRTLDYAGKADVVGAFLLWYESVPPVRTNASKIIEVQGELCRLNCKENSTMMTVARGLLAFFTCAGVISPSNAVAPTEESRVIWSAIKSVLRACSVRKGGMLDLSQSSAGCEDLVKLMLKSKGISTPFQLQAWLLAMVLSGTGLRIGSLRNSDDPLKNRKHKKTLLSSGGNESRSSRKRRSSFDMATPDDFDIDCESSSSSSDESDDVDKEIVDKGADATDECMNIDFDCLVAGDVSIYRLPKATTDPEDCVRLRAEISVSSTKTTGVRLFAKKIIGYHYPTISHDGTLNWSPNVALALTMLSVINGTVDCKTVVADESEPEPGKEILLSKDNQELRSKPLFRQGKNDGFHSMSPDPMRCCTSSLREVADSLRIPAIQFTSRAFRSGFAKELVASTVLRSTDSNRIVTLEEIKQSLYSSSHWKSAQVLRYTQNVTKSLQRESHSDSGCSAQDWLYAVFNCSPWAKNNYHHLEMEGLEKYLLRDSKENNCEPPNLDGMTWHMRRNMVDTINASNWRASGNRVLSFDEIKAELTHHPVCSVKDTLSSLECFLASVSFEHQPFHGYARYQNEAPYRCPVVNCNDTVFLSVQESNRHWIECHRSKESSSF